MLTKQSLIREETSKRIYSTENDEHLIVEFLDALDFNDSDSKRTVKGIGAINNNIAAYLQNYLEGYHISTHFVRSISENEMLVKNTRPIPIEVVIQNVSNDSLTNRFGIESDQELQQPVIEYYWKNADRGNPLINGSHAVAIGLLRAEELRGFERLIQKANAVLLAFFFRRQLKLRELVLHFAVYKKTLVITSNLSLDTISLMDPQSKMQYNEFLTTKEDAEIISALATLQQTIVGENV